MVDNETTVDDSVAAAGPRAIFGRLLVVAIVATIPIWFLSVASTGISSERVKNPRPHGSVVYDDVPRVREPLWGFHYWPYLVEIATVVVAAGLWAFFIIKSVRERRVSPGLILMVASTLVLVFDPLFCWATFAVYDPRLLHLPVDWPYVRMAPDIEPLFVVAGYPFFFIIPGAIAVAIDRRWIAPHLPRSHWLTRHAVMRVFITGMLVAIIFDFVAELSMMRTELWVLSQVPGPTLHVGTHQWPVLWEPLLLSPTLAATAVMLIRDDRGRTLTHRVAARISWLKRRKFWGPVLVAWVIYTVAAVGICIGGFTVIRLTGNADHLEQPFPFKEIKVYDPQGRFEVGGEPGPYYEGTWPGPRVGG